MKELEKAIEHLENCQELDFNEIKSKLSVVEFNYIEKKITTECVINFSAKIISEIDSHKHFINVISEDKKIDLKGYYNLLLLINSAIENEVYKFSKYGQ